MLEYEDVPDAVIMPESCGIKLAFMGMAFPDNAQALNDPNVWMGHTAATVHTTPHKIRIVSNDNQSSEQVITVGNGTSECTSMFGNLKGMIYNKEGLEKGSAVLKDVAYSPQMKFNLCNL